MSETRLSEIIAAHRARAAADSRSIDVLGYQANDLPAPRNFGGVLDSHGLSIIAEIKRRSPSAGSLNVDLDVRKIAGDYANGGAVCLSVLTDNDFFGGSVEDLQTARSAAKLPTLRKDFTVDARDVFDARLMGADAILLIVAALSDEELLRFGQLADELGLSALYEVHDDVEIKRAVDAGAAIIGVNQRDLHTFEIDNTLAERLVDKLPASVVKVAESGIKTPDDARRLASAGFDAALIGTSFVTAASPEASVRQIVEAGASV